MKPRLGLLRSREFVMKDMYTFDVDLKNAKHSYKIVCDRYENILNRLGIPFKVLQANTGSIGGIYSHEYHYMSEIGENFINTCDKCNYYIENTLDNKYLCPKCNKEMEPKNSIEVFKKMLLLK